MTRHIVRDDIPDPTVDDLRVNDRTGCVTWAPNVEHPVWSDLPVLGYIRPRLPGLSDAVAPPDGWRWIPIDSYLTGRDWSHADTRHRALEDLLEDALGPYERAGDVMDQARRVA